MCSTAALVVDRVFPDVPVRQWVLSTPFELRLLLASNARAFGALTRIFAEEVLALQRRRAADLDSPESENGPSEGGLIVFQQRFGGSLNLNTHLHAVAADGVFVRQRLSADDSEPRAAFRQLPPPRQADLSDLVFRVYRRMAEWLRRRGFIGASAAESAMSPGPLEECLRGSLGVGRLCRLREADSKQGRSADQTENRRFGQQKSPQAAAFGGFGVHAGVTVPEGDAASRERLVRYCARPPLSLERLSLTEAGLVIYRLRNPRNRQQTHRVMQPQEFLARLVALIPPPRHPLIRFYGVFAPNSRWRPLCIPAASATPSDCSTNALMEGAPMEGRTLDGLPAPVRPSSSKPSAGATLEATPSGTPPHSPASPSDPEVSPRRFWRIDWATLLRRTYDIDVLACECGSRLRIVALITEPATIEHILTVLGLPSQPPPIARARSPDAA